MADLSTFSSSEGDISPSVALKELVEVRSRYHHLCNEIIKPRSQIRETRYFWRKWRRLLGATLTIIVIEARDRCFRNMHTGEERNYFSMSLDEFASACDISERTLRRALKHEHAGKFISIEATYRYDAILKKKVRGPNKFEVFLDDPLTPEDQSLLAEKLNQHELQSLLGQGVVDLAKYVSLKESSPTGQNVRKVNGDQPDKMTARSPDEQTCEDHSKIDQPDKMATRLKPAKLHEKHLADKVSERCADNSVDLLANPPLLNSTYSTLASTTIDLGAEVIDEGLQTPLKQMTAAVVDKFDNCISEQTTLGLIQNTSLENVQNQLDWFDHRDSSWAKRGPAAAFVTYCRQQAGEPDGLIAARSIEQQQRTIREGEERRQAYESFAQAEYERLVSEMPPEEFTALSDAMMTDLQQSAFWRNIGQESPAFQANLQVRVLELSGIPKFEEWQEEGR